MRARLVIRSCPSHPAAYLFGRRGALWGSVRSVVRSGVMRVDILRCLHALVLPAVVAVMLVVVHWVGLVLGSVSRGRLGIGLRVVLVVASTVACHPSSAVHGLCTAAAAATRGDASVDDAS